MSVALSPRRRLGRLAVLAAGLLAGPVAQAAHQIDVTASACDGEQGFGTTCDGHNGSSVSGQAGAAAELYGVDRADVIQGYGVFHGSARAYLTVSGQAGDLHGTAYHASANAIGTFADTLTIGGGTGIGFLHLTYSVSGKTSSTGVGAGYDSDAFLTASVGSTSHGADGAKLYGDLESGNVTGSAVVDMTGSMPFYFNQPLDLVFVTAARAQTGFDASYFGKSFTGEAAAGFSDTAVLTAIRAFDAQGNEIPGITIQAESGTVYPLVDMPTSPVPEPGSAALMGLGVVALLGRRARVGRLVRDKT